MECYISVYMRYRAYLQQSASSLRECDASSSIGATSHVPTGNEWSMIDKARLSNDDNQSCDERERQSTNRR